MRLYNGCPDSELKEKWASERRATEALTKFNAHCTYFPLEQKYLVFNDNFNIIGEFQDTIILACNKAMLLLSNKEQS